LIAVQPLGTVAAAIYAGLVFGLVLVGSVLAVYHRRRLFWVGVVLGLPATVLIVADPGGDPGPVGLAFGIATLSFVCVSLLIRIFERPTVSAASPRLAPSPLPRRLSGNSISWCSWPAW